MTGIVEQTVTVPRDSAVAKRLQADEQWLDELVEKYPSNIPVKVLSDYIGCTPQSLRAAIMQSQVFGLYYRQPGNKNYNFVVPTCVFLRWYCKVDYLA